MKLYFPTSSENLSTIFSTESISPYVFYKKRTFGSKRFKRTEEFSADENNIILFNRKYRFELPYNDEYESFLTVFEFDLNEEDMKNLDKYDIDAENQPVLSNKDFTFIVKPNTLYLDAKTTTIYFNNEKEKDAVFSKLNPMSEAKNIKKYKIEIPYNSTEQFPKIKYPKIKKRPDDFIDNQLKLEKKFNSVKGMVYGYIYSNITSLFIFNALKRILKEIEDKFAVMINQKYSKKNNEILKLVKKLKKELNSIWRSSDADFKICKDFPYAYIETIDKKVLQECSDNEIKEHYEEILKSFNRLVKFTKNSVSSLVIKLEHQIKNIPNSKNKLAITKVKSIEDLISRLEKKFDDFKNKRISEISDKEVLLPNISLNKESISIEPSEPKTIDLFSTIIDTLIKHPKSNEKQFVEVNDAKEIIKKIGLIIRSQFGESKWEKMPPERNYLLKLHEDIERIDNKAKVDSNLISLSYFMTKPDKNKMEDLINRLIGNNAKEDEYRIALAYWGAFYGYSSFSKIYIDPINENEEISSKLHEYFNKMWNDIWKVKAVDNIAETEKKLPQKELFEKS